MREDGPHGKQAVVVAYGVNDGGAREVVGIDVVHTESKDSWMGFLRSLVAQRTARRAPRSQATRTKGSEGR